MDSLCVCVHVLDVDVYVGCFRWQVVEDVLNAIFAIKRDMAALQPVS